MSSGKTSAMLLAASALFASAARGQDASTGAAIALFDEGVKLMEEGKYSGACPRLARSQQLAPSGGTLLALAECYEKNGQFASAWIAYKEVSARARTAGKLDAERRATELTQKIEPRVAWLTINVSGTPGGAPPTVTRDGQPVPSAEWSVAVPIDPGPHSIQATAPGRRPFAREIVVPTRGERTTIDVPPLDPLPENGAPTSPVAPPSSEGGTQRTIGIVLGGAGVVGLAVGTIFGLSAMSKNDEAASRCRTETLCDAEGLRLDSEGRDAATVSTVAFVVGLAAVGGGVALYLTAPQSRAPSNAVVVRAAGLGAVLGGTF
jgi:hypothetical protein